MQMLLIGKMWRHSFELLAKTNLVIAFDRRGFGETVYVDEDYSQTGTVDMHYRQEGGTTVISSLQAGDIFFANAGCEHVAHPRGEARILVIETEGSI